MKKHKTAAELESELRKAELAKFAHSPGSEGRAAANAECSRLHKAWLRAERREQREGEMS